MNIAQAVERLNQQLPLAARQAALPVQLRRVHQHVLRSLLARGRSPARQELADLLAGYDVDAALARLGGDDLIVLDAAGTTLVGAYPLTTEATPHRLNIGGTQIHAMCALDALAVAPMFGVAVTIDSQCRLSAEPIHIEIARETLQHTAPATTVVGVRWQMPQGCAAHSMCTEMVFLRDAETAMQWRHGDQAYASLFDLSTALAFGAAFFRPLLA